MKQVRLTAIFVVGLICLELGSWGLAWPAESLGGISLDEVSPRIITPNGDGLNDAVFLKFSDSIVGVPLESSVVDINGGKVSELQRRQDIDDVLTWDGKDAGGHAVPAGIYIYSVKLGGHQATGTVVVAR
jgi:hypothetical protein